MISMIGGAYLQLSKPLVGSSYFLSIGSIMKAFSK